MDPIKALAAADLTKREARVAALLIAAGGEIRNATLDEMSKATGLAVSSLSRAIQSLASRGMVKAKKDGIRYSSIRIIPARLCCQNVYKGIDKLANEKGSVCQNVNGFSLLEPYGPAQVIDFEHGADYRCGLNLNIYSLEEEDQRDISEVELDAPDLLLPHTTPEAQEYLAGQENPNATERSPNRKQRHSAAFEEFWQAYPRKIAKRKCSMRWMSAKLDAELPKMLADIARRIDEEEWEVSRKGKQYIPHPYTYLNQERWLDEDVVESDADDDDPTPWLTERMRSVGL